MESLAPERRNPASPLRIWAARLRLLPQPKFQRENHIALDRAMEPVSASHATFSQLASNQLAIDAIVGESKEFLRGHEPRFGGETPALIEMSPASLVQVRSPTETYFVSK